MKLKINQGGVMPVIFASTILTFLTIFLNYLLNLQFLSTISLNLTIRNLLYGAGNFGLILVFSLFYSNLILNPKELATNLNKMAVVIHDSADFTTIIM